MSTLSPGLFLLPFLLSLQLLSNAPIATHSTNHLTSQAALQRFDSSLDPSEAALPLTRIPGLGLPTPVPIPNLQRLYFKVCVGVLNTRDCMRHTWQRVPDVWPAVCLSVCVCGGSGGYLDGEAAGAVMLLHVQP